MTIKLKSFVLCDDVRKEVTQKDILIGVYASGISLPQFPLDLSMAFWAEITPSETGQYSCEFKFEPPSSRPPVIIGLGLEVMTIDNSNIAFPGVVLNFESEGDLVISFRCGEDEWSEVARKKIVSSSV